MRTPAVALLLAVTTAPLAAQTSVHRALPAGASATIRVYNLAGRVRIIGGATDSVSVAGTVGAGGRLVMGGNSGAIKIGIDGAPGDTATVPADLTVRVPAGARVWVKSATASIDVDGVRGELDLSTISGTVRVHGAPRVVTAESIDGPVTLRSHAEVTRVRSADGALVVDSAGGDVTAITVSGRVAIIATRPLSLGHVESVTGPVLFSGPLPVDGNLDIQTHESMITLELPRDQRASMDVMAFSGKVMTGFPGAVRSAASGKPVHLELGGGGARIGVRSLKGGVIIRALP